jgi:hypothetical protein
MVSCLVRLYIASETRLCLLEKSVDFHSMPRVDEWVKLLNAEMGDVCPNRVYEIIHREGDVPALSLDQFPADEEEHDKYVASYIASGWTHVSTEESRSVT